MCAKFTGKTCLVPRSDEFECQGQSSKVKVTRDKTEIIAASSPMTMHCKACAVCAANDVQQRRDHSVSAEGGDRVTEVHGDACGVCLVKHL